MTTLRELLDELYGQHADEPAMLTRLDAIESWAYGEEQKLPAPGSEEHAERYHVMYPGPWDDARAWLREHEGAHHGTGKTREPGLVERVMGYSRDDVYDRLKQELGDSQASR